MMLKKIICVWILIMMMFSLIGCQQTQPNPTQPQNTGKTYPAVSGTFMQPWAFADYDVARMTEHLRYLKDVGIELLIIQNTFTATDTISQVYFDGAITEDVKAQQFNEKSKGFLEVVLESAKSLGMQVYVGLANDGDWWKKVFTDEQWLESHVAVSMAGAKAIYDSYKSRYADTLTGWYFWPEYWNMNADEEQMARGAKFLSDYRDGLYVIDPHMPMLLSPYITDAVDAEKTGQFWTTILSNSTLRQGDIFCCQDSVGAGNVTVEQIDDYFAAMKKAAEQKPGLHFWANNEDFTPDFKSADMGRFKKQLDITHKYTDTHISFAFCHYRNPDMSKTAAYEAYQYYYKNGELLKSKPATPAVTVDSQNRGMHIDFHVTVDNSAGDVYAVVITKEGKKVFEQIFDQDTSLNKTLTANYMDVNLNAGPCEYYYMIYTVDHYGNTSGEVLEKCPVYTVGL